MKANWMSNDGELGDTIPVSTLHDNGVFYRLLDEDPKKFQAPLDEIKSDRGYITQDEVALRPDNPNLDAICAKFIDEHYHDEDEVRFVLEGGGIFDIRSKEDKWMRVHVEVGDLIVVPAKRHHRFLLTDDKNIRCVRLFQDSSGWVPHYRG